MVKGERHIRAEVPGKTTIISNQEFDYSRKKIEISEVVWWKKLFRVAHTKMDHDPAVWQMVEKMIMQVISTPEHVRTAQSNKH
jgi:hypothetical protein